MKAYAPHEGEWSASRPGRFIPLLKEPLVPTGYDAGRALETIRTMWNTENVFPLP
jgi:hypothetical protein